MEDFTSLFDKLHAGKRIWVRLYDGLKVCLVAVHSTEDSVFVAKFLPCAVNSRNYPIKYDDIQSIEKVEEANGGET